MAQETTTEEMDKIVPVVIAKMEHQSFQSICDELGRSYQSLQQAFRRRGILIEALEIFYKKKSQHMKNILTLSLINGARMININLLHTQAQIPQRGSDESAGLDLHTVDSVTIPPGQRALLRTGFAMSMPQGYVGLIWPRSKLAAKMGVDVLAGVVDSDYRGEVMISLLNTGLDPVEIKTGDKVAQMIIQRHSSSMEINVVDDLDRTMRGKAGVNSSEMRLR